MKVADGKRFPRALRSIRLGGLILVGLVIYAYGFQVTKVDLEETRSENRRAQLVRILRALAHPDLVSFPQEEVTVSAPISMPCPTAPVQQREINPRGAYILVTPNCVESGGRVQIEGFNLEHEADVTLFMVPPSQVNLRIGEARTDVTGHFLAEVQLPERPSDQVQSVSVVTRQSVGTPRLTRTAYDTWDKIIETVFLALLATTLSTAIAVPLSFFAARNLMKGVTSTMLGVSLSILAAPAGVAVGATIAPRLAGLAMSVSHGATASLVGAVLAALAAWLVARWALPPEELAPPTRYLRLARAFAVALAGLASLVALAYTSDLLLRGGKSLVSSIPSLSFLGSFVFNLGEILEMLLTAGTALAAAGVLVSLFGRVGRTLSVRLPRPALHAVQLVVGAAAGAVLLVLLGAAIDWFYEFRQPTLTLYVPAAVGAAFGLGLSLRYAGRDVLPVGLVIYYVARTIFNVLRSIEALIMVIVFAVWVGIGPFAGVLALSLHSIAALAKLYSEQVESILPGPLEAITSTGATRMQTIVYAVVPQIIPPYISFTMYRWDINVRMSTIIGFAGGGGIGFLLQQNINLLNYRAASAQMLAIAIVVGAMDYVSSALRERVV